MGVSAFPSYPSIVWTDTVGPAILTTLVDRLGNWMPDEIIVGQEGTQLGSGLVQNFVFRTDYVVSFELPYIPMAQTPLLQRLKFWLAGGGQVTVNTNDNALRTYTCVIWPSDGSGQSKQPKWTYDRVNMEYTLTAYLKNIAASNLLAIYPPAGGTPLAQQARLIVTPSPATLTYP
jgi:hypothetical protein